MGLQISRGVHPEVPETNPVRATEKRLGRGVPAIGIAKREPDRRGAFDVRSRAYDDLDTTEVFGIASGRVHQREECDPSCTSIRRAKAEFCWAEFLGSRILCVNGGRDETVIREYIRNQEKEDERLDPMKLEY